MVRIIPCNVAGGAKKQGQTEVHPFKDPMLNEKQEAGDDLPQAGDDLPQDVKGSRYHCEECGKKFRRCGNFQNHMNMHDRNATGGGKKLQCSVCDRKFQAENTLQKHMMIHKKEQLYCCALCGEKFLRDYQLGYHRCHLLDKKLLLIENGSKKRKWQTSEVDNTRCPVCDKFFTSIGGWQRHMTIHFGQQNFKCSLCPKQFTGTRELRNHTRLHTGERPFKCSWCPKTCATKSNMDSHEKIHVAVYYVCCVCGKEFVKKSCMQAHKCELNEDGGSNDDSKFMCNICGKNCKCISALKEHMSAHKDTHPHKCSWCGERFKQKQNLTKHHKKQRPLLKSVDDYPFECTVCLNRFSKQIKLEKHKTDVHCVEDLLQDHPQKEIPDVQNDEKKKTAKNVISVDTVLSKNLEINDSGDTKKQKGSPPESLFRHDKHKGPNKDLVQNESQTNASLQRHLTIHKGEGQFYCCGLCGEKFLRHYHLSHHSCHRLDSKLVLAKDGSKKRKWQTSERDNTQCPICKKVFTTNGSWQRHMTIHLGQQSFTCPLCSRKFIGRRELRNHLRLHMGERPFKCSFCPKRCVSKSNMAIHEKSHLAVYYACCICGKEFLEQDGLQGHKCGADQNCEPDVDPKFSCNICDENFKLVSVLKQHMVGHADTHPHTCSQCGNGFKLERDLKKHHKKERPSSECLEDYPHQCGVCLKRFDKPRKLKIHSVHAHSKKDQQQNPLQKKKFICQTNVSMPPLSEKLVANVSSGTYTFENAQDSVHVQVGDQELNDNNAISQSSMYMYGLQEYECLFCDKKLPTKNRLKSHLKIHTGVKPHECSKCRKRFDTRSALKKHKRSHKKKR